MTTSRPISELEKIAAESAENVLFNLENILGGCTKQNLDLINQYAYKFLEQCFNKEKVDSIDNELKRYRTFILEEANSNNDSSEVQLLEPDYVCTLFEKQLLHILRKHFEHIYHMITTAPESNPELKTAKTEALQTLMKGSKPDNSTKNYSTYAVNNGFLHHATNHLTIQQYATNILETQTVIQAHATSENLSRETPWWEQAWQFIKDVFNPTVKVFSDKAIRARSTFNMFAETEKKVSKEVAAITESKPTLVCA